MCRVCAGSTDGGKPVCIYDYAPRQVYPQRMTKRLVDIDDDLLQAARSSLSTTTIRETVNRALSDATAAARRREFLQRMAADGLPDLRDPDVLAAAWR